MESNSCGYHIRCFRGIQSSQEEACGWISIISCPWLFRPSGKNKVSESQFLAQFSAGRLIWLLVIITKCLRPHCSYSIQRRQLTLSPGFGANQWCCPCSETSRMPSILQTHLKLDEFLVWSVQCWHAGQHTIWHFAVYLTWELLLISSSSRKGSVEMMQKL